MLVRCLPMNSTDDLTNRRSGKHDEEIGGRGNRGGDSLL